MSRAGEGGRLKKHNCCLTCSIISFIITIIFFVALYVGGSILFKTYVSPQIGGLGLNDVIALSANVLSGKEAETTYAEEDLNSFYSGLSDAMFLSDKTEDELEYELVSTEARVSLAPLSSEEGSTYDEDAAYAAFLLKSKSDRYALLTENVKAQVALAEYSDLAGNSDAAIAVREKLGLKTYRLSITSLLGDMNFGAEDFSAEKGLEKSLSSLDFNFDVLKDYDINNAAAATNEKFTTFSVNGKQVSAFINDVITYFLESESSPLTSSLKGTVMANVKLTDYVKVASVTIMNTPLATAGEEALFDQKDTALGLSISLNLRAMVVAAMETPDLKDQLSSVPSFATNLIPHLVPKHFSAHVTIYPLAAEDDHREMVLMVNKKSDKNAKRLSTLLNALLSNDGEDAASTFLGGINDQVASVFSSVNETVKINFVPSKDKEGKPLKDEKGNTYSEMKIMTWETVLSLIDSEGRLSAHDVFTMLKCLYISDESHPELSLDGAMDGFKSDMSAKYGVKSSYLEENNILSADDLGSMIENIDLKSVDFTKENDEMRVRLSAEALASFMKKMLTKEEEAESPGEVTAAESDSLLKGLDPKVTDITIKKVSDKEGVKVYSFEIGLTADIAEMLGDQLPSEGVAGSLSRKILPKHATYFGIMLYLSEYEEDGKVLHKVGKNIDNPAEGETSAWASKVRINDFTYDETSRVFDALNTFMQVLSGSSFEISSLTGSLEDTMGEVFDSLASNQDFNLTLRLYEAEGEDKGGINLPSIYELVESLVKPKLKEEETFTSSDAKDVLYLMYTKEVSMEKTFNLEENQDQAEDFLDEINDKFYIKKASALHVSDLFGDGASGLSEKIKADSIYFKPTDAEEALWKEEKGETYVKKSLYTDTRSAAALKVSLTGSEIAALVKDSNLIPEDMISSFGSIEVLGATFDTTEDKKTYLTFDMKLLFNKESSGEGEAIKYGSLVPNAIKLSAKVLLYITGEEYPEGEERYSATIVLNNESDSKVFMLMHALGGEDLSEKTITDKISQSIKGTFDALEGKIPLSFSNAGVAYTSNGEQCIKISDVFSFLIKETAMTDSDAVDAPATDPDDLAARLRAFGEQTMGDRPNESNYDWMGDKLKTFTLTDDTYIYQNMQLAYFLNDTPTMDTIYNFASKFNTIKDDAFNLTGENGLFYYDGDIRNLKVSDRALAVIVKTKESASFSGAVTGEGMTVDLVSFKFYHEKGDLVLESGVKIAFDGRDSYKMMPDYFFAIAKTVRHYDGELGKYVYTTTITLNNATSEETDTLFKNISKLSSKGLDASKFDKDNIVEKINTALSTALEKFPSTVTFGEFTAEDVTNEYNQATYGDTIRIAAGDGYISFPSVYSYLIDMFYTSEKPTEKALQHMLNSLHKGDEALQDVLVTNPLSATAYYDYGFTGTTVFDAKGVIISSDRYLANQISTRFSSVSLQDGKLSLADAIKQVSVLGKLGESEVAGERAVWESKFFKTGSYVTTDNYLIATICVSLSSYNTGDKTSLLPENLWFSVLADMDTASSSKGLLFNMSHEDMEIFEHILQHSGFSTFDIDGIAAEFAGKIGTALDSFVDDVLSGATLDYKLASDPLIFYKNIVNIGDANYAVDASEGVEALMADEKPNGVGYIVLSK